MQLTARNHDTSEGFVDTIPKHNAITFVPPFGSHLNAFVILEEFVDKKKQSACSYDDDTYFQGAQIAGLIGRNDAKHRIKK